MKKKKNSGFCGDTAALWQAKQCARDNTVHPTLKGKLHVWWFWFRGTKATGECSAANTVVGT